ncbi:pyridoxal 5'-phosphate synthase lyase subunit PdxS [Candidatus Parcubacteria bacterium]|jgi:pyridoxal 5'-phosphate synthase pdxS subunit|nr:pyridoxal 5'-phosphate synthase lyase subunit PdxS [Candidatus Parcubacteria bacterium]MBT3948619.1 pyridoxal 5'-phosphate synthase lyase subunit PdxS [Candidatus Parcubacteria bacterium]
MEQNTFELKSGLAQMLKGGVIMDVMNVEQAKIAEAAGAVAVMALERIPSQIREDGGVARMSDPNMIKEIKKAVSIPVMAKVRIGHFVEAQVLESLDIDYIDESEVLTPADEEFHIEKNNFKLPFVSGCRNLGEAVRRLHEGAAMIRTKGEAGTGNIVEATRHLRKIQTEIAALTENNLEEKAKEYRVPVDIIKMVFDQKKLPVVMFVAGGIATPADAAMMMQMGAEGIFVGSGIFGAQDPQKMAEAIVKATMNFDKPEIIAEVSSGLGKTMKSLEIDKLETRYAGR